MCSKMNTMTGYRKLVNVPNFVWTQLPSLSGTHTRTHTVRCAMSVFYVCFSSFRRLLEEPLKRRLVILVIEYVIQRRRRRRKKFHSRFLSFQFSCAKPPKWKKERREKMNLVWPFCHSIVFRSGFQLIHVGNISRWFFSFSAGYEWSFGVETVSVKEFVNPSDRASHSTQHTPNHFSSIEFSRSQTMHRHKAYFGWSRFVNYFRRLNNKQMNTRTLCVCTHINSTLDGDDGVLLLSSSSNVLTHSKSNYL